MITLPPPTHRTSLISFWLTISLFGGLLIGVLLVPPVSFWSLGLVVLVTAALALPGVLQPQIASIPYRVWNKLARYFACYASMLLMGICFYVIFVAVGRTGSSLRLVRPTATESLWVPRGTLAPTAYASLHTVATEGSLKQGWIPLFLSWALRSGNLWAGCLLPFLILLSTLESDEESAFPTGIYTLF